MPVGTFYLGLFCPCFVAYSGVGMLFVYVGKCVFIGRSNKKDKVFPIFLPKNIKRCSAGFITLRRRFPQ